MRELRLDKLYRFKILVGTFPLDCGKKRAMFDELLHYAVGK